MKLLYLITLSVCFFMHGFLALAQPNPINKLIENADSTRKHLPIEKLYLQLDKPGYLQLDTIWFKAYLLNADYLTAAKRSGLLYVELDDINNRSVKRIVIPAIAGMGWGNLFLDESIPEGNYTLRAYTNWMRNFGEQYVFKKTLYIASAGKQSRLVAADFNQTKQAGKDNITARILVSQLNGQPVRLQEMQMKVIDGKHTLLKDNASTGVDGRLNVNFNLPDNTSTKDISLVLSEITKGIQDAAVLTIPVTLNRLENIDLQFMPEGGDLVAGIPSRVGLKAIDEHGKSIEVSGSIYDSKKQEIAVFNSTHKGIGSFELIPSGGESYTAVITLPGGTSKSYPLPVVQPSGTAIRVSDYYKKDSLRITISVSPSLINPAARARFYLIGQSRGVICYGAEIVIKSAASVVQVPKSLFPTGIARFTLMNDAGQPLNERLCFIDHGDNLALSITTDKQSYAPHDSIALHILVTDKSGSPVQGSFSLAVTDNNQVKTDSMGNNIANSLLLTSDLKGFVEEPEYYFENNRTQSGFDLDNLLLTQGWVGYDWKQLTTGPIPVEYAAEKEFTVSGKVTNAFNKNVAGTQVILLSKTPAFVKDTRTDKNGKFTFAGFLPADTASFMIQAKNKQGNSFNVGITVDEFKPPVFKESQQIIMPWYVNSDTTLLHSLYNRLAQQQADFRLTGTHVLKEVKIKAKKVVKNSKNLNGPGGADEVLDEKDMEKAGKLTLLQILQQKKISGFSDANHIFRLHFNLLFFIIDGVNIDSFLRGRVNNEERYQYLKTFLDNITAEDIIGIEAMYNPSTYMKYDFNFYYDLTVHVGDPYYAYIEVTTRSGNGAFAKATPGAYLYKPLPLSLPKLFYRPKYVKNAPNREADLRSTIHWEPNIVTDKEGKATVSFFSADKPATYSALLEGTDLNGSIGFTRRKLVIKK